MEKIKGVFKDRYFILGMFFLAFSLVISLKLFELQIVKGEEYNKVSKSRVLKESTIVAPRGKIFDRYGVPIAVNQQGFIVQIVKAGVSNDDMNEMLLKLANIFIKNQDNYQDSLTKYLTFNPPSFNGKSWDVIRKWELNKDKIGIEKQSDLKKTPQELFKYLRNEKFKIDPKYSDADAYKIMLLRYEILVDNWKFTTGGTITLAESVSRQTIAEIEEKHHEFPGVITDVEPVRKYIDATDVAHVLGYVRAINGDQLEDLKSQGYDSNDIIGQSGIEKAAEKYLKGTDGSKVIEVNENGRLTNEQDSVAAVPGDDVVLTLDMNLQKVAMASLKKNIDAIKTKGGDNNFGDANAGAVVAIDVNSGEILAMASYPSYDPSIFLAGSEDKAARQAIKDLQTNENKPELNRAIAGTYAPGSTFKPLTAIAALQEKIITPSWTFNDRGVITIGGRELLCLEHPRSGHGVLNLKSALETSCNIYFYEIGSNTTIDNLAKWAGYFGLGKKTNIDIGGEASGLMSSKEYKKQKNEIWRPADTAQVSIGQLYNSFTPVQIANYIASIANGGKRYQPHLIKSVKDADGKIVSETKPSFYQIPVEQSNINAIKEGMVAVTQSVDGTANQAFIGFPYTVAGKTGTAQTGKEAKHSSNALFVCYAPAEKPEIAIAVVVERGAWGSYTAPIARDILDEYFGLNKTTTVSDTAMPENPVFTR